MFHKSNVNTCANESHRKCFSSLWVSITVKNSVQEI